MWHCDRQVVDITARHVFCHRQGTNYSEKLTNQNCSEMPKLWIPPRLHGVGYISSVSLA